jgi:hypothetical protein
MTDLAEAPVIEHATANSVLGRWRNLYFNLWQQRSGASEMMAVYELQRSYLERSGRRIAALSLIQRSAIGAVDDDMRAAIKYATTHILNRTLVGATVIPAGGFGGAMIRSLFAGINLFQRLPYPNKITESMAEGCAWVAGYVDGNPSPEQVEAACKTMQGSLLRA